MWIEEERWIEEEKGIIDIDRGFPLLEMLRLRMYSLESYESPRRYYPGVWVVSFPYASYSFYWTKV